MKRKLDVILEGVKEARTLREAFETPFDAPTDKPFMEEIADDLVLFCPRCKCENFPSDYGPLEQMECYLCGFVSDRTDFRNA